MIFNLFNLRNNVLPYQNPVLFCSRSKGFIVMNASKSTCMRKLGFHRYEMYEKVSIHIKKLELPGMLGRWITVQSPDFRKMAKLRLISNHFQGGFCRKSGQWNFSTSHLQFHHFNQPRGCQSSALNQWEQVRTLQNFQKSYKVRPTAHASPRLPAVAACWAGNFCHSHREDPQW